MASVNPPASMAGHLALDFANTAAWHASEHPTEHVGDYARLVAWGRASGLLTTAEADALARAGAARPDEAAAAHARAIALREAFYRTASAIAAGEEAARADLATVRVAWADAFAHAALAPASGEDGAPLALAWLVGDPDALDAPLDVPCWRLAHAMGTLLTAGPLDRLRECAGHPCGWLFLDRSRNRTRRWCDSADCGNRARVREHLVRRRAARERR